MQNVTRFLRDNAEVIVSVCVVLSIVLGAALFYLTRLPVFNEPTPYLVERSTATEASTETPVTAEEEEEANTDEDAYAPSDSNEMPAETDDSNPHSPGGESDPNRPQ